MFMAATKIAFVMYSVSLIAQEQTEMKESDLKEQDLCLMQEKKEESYYLAGVIYFSKDKWTIWINDQKIQADQKDQLPFSFEVFAEKILITFNGKTYALMCDQTFFPQTQKILNGDQRSPC